MASEAQRRATRRFEEKAYFKTLVRFKKEDEKRIRAAAGDSLNGYIVKCVLDNLENAQNSAIKPETPEIKADTTSRQGEKTEEEQWKEMQAMIDERRAMEKLRKAEKESKNKNIGDDKNTEK